MANLPLQPTAQDAAGTQGSAVYERSQADAEMITPDSAPNNLCGSWRLLCSCGWPTRVSQEWMAESAAKLHQKLGSPETDHVVSIEEAR